MFFSISSQLSVDWSLLIHSINFLQPLVLTKSSEIKKKGQIEKLFNDFLPNRDYFQQNLRRLMEKIVYIFNELYINV